MKAIRTSFFAILLLVTGKCQALECFNVNTTTHRQVDLQGRERYFHGVNVVVKGPPWIPRTDKFDPKWSFVEKDMTYLNNLGLNAVRFGVMWPGVEAIKGHYNMTYLQIAENIFKQCAEYNISIIVDMHQDVFNPMFCGEGFPDWAVDIGDAKAFPVPLGVPFKHQGGDNPYPSLHECQQHAWADYQFTEAVSAAYQSIYSNRSGLLDKLAQYWGKVAEQFKDIPNILGYELINEPWAGDVFNDPLLFIPGAADKKNLAHTYDVVTREIKKHDTCHNIMFESVTWDPLTVGFDVVPGGPQYKDKSILSYHFYVPPLTNIEITLTERMKDMKRMQCGGFMTEFNINGANAFVSETMDHADDFLQSWAGWDYKSYYDITGDSGAMWFMNSSLNMQFVTVLSRTYAQAVAGMTNSMNFNTKTKTFKLSYTITSSCSSRLTEIYLNEELHYPKGYEVSITPSNAATYRSSAKNHIEVTHSASIPQGTVVSVVVTAKQ